MEAFTVALHQVREDKSNGGFAPMIDIKAIRQRAERYASIQAKCPTRPHEIIALCDEIERLQDLLGKANALCRIRADEIERLQLDAARYQFMRRQTISHRARKQIMNAVDELCEDEMDAAIDAAMEVK